jgi:hypothetical protein
MPATAIYLHFNLIVHTCIGQHSYIVSTLTKQQSVDVHFMGHKSNMALLIEHGNTACITECCCRRVARNAREDMTVCLSPQASRAKKNCEYEDVLLTK